MNVSCITKHFRKIHEYMEYNLLYTLGRYNFGISWERERLVRILPNRRLACLGKLTFITTLSILRQVRLFPDGLRPKSAVLLHRTLILYINFYICVVFQISGNFLIILIVYACLKNGGYRSVVIPCSTVSN